MNAPLQLGLALDLGSDRAAGPLGEQFDRAGRLLADAESVGFASVWVGESFHADPRPFHLPAALLVLARLAGTTGLGLGTGVLLARAYDVERLGVEVELLAAATGDRLTLGVGLGPDHLRGRFGGPDVAGGAHLDAVLRRLERTTPRVLVGGKGAAALRRALRADGYYGATNYSERLVAAQVAAYRAGGGTGAVALNRICVVDRDGDRARAHAEEHFARVLGYYRAQQAWDVGREPGDPEPLLVGTPTEVVDRLRHYKRMGVTHVQLRPAPAGAPTGLALRSTAEIGEHVVPLIRSEEYQPS